MPFKNPTPDGYFALCPSCHQCDGYLNVGKGHWLFCKAHQVRWYVGSNLFSSWRDQTEEEQRQIFDDLNFGEYRTIRVDETYHPPSESNGTIKFQRLERAIDVATEQALELARKLEGNTPAELGFDGMTAEQLVASEWKCWFEEELREHEKRQQAA
jgi:hypothetical protein